MLHTVFLKLELCPDSVTVTSQYVRPPASAVSLQKVSCSIRSWSPRLRLASHDPPAVFSIEVLWCHLFSRFCFCVHFSSCLISLVKAPSFALCFYACLNFSLSFLSSSALLLFFLFIFLLVFHLSLWIQTYFLVNFFEYFLPLCIPFGYLLFAFDRTRSHGQCYSLTRTRPTRSPFEGLASNGVSRCFYCFFLQIVFAFRTVHSQRFHHQLTFWASGPIFFRGTRSWTTKFWVTGAGMSMATVPKWSTQNSHAGKSWRYSWTCFLFFSQPRSLLHKCMINQGAGAYVHVDVRKIFQKWPEDDFPKTEMRT